MGSDESHFNVSLIVKDKVTRQYPQTTTFLKRSKHKQVQTNHNLSEEIQTQTGPNKRLFILTRTHSMQIFGEIPFVKSQNDT